MKKELFSFGIVLIAAVVELVALHHGVNGKGLELFMILVGYSFGRVWWHLKKTKGN